jgi:hypothetical protein
MGALPRHGVVMTMQRPVIASGYAVEPPRFCGLRSVGGVS